MLHVREISAGYGNARVLHSVSIDVAEGECVAIIGANGAGKSTLMKTISGLVRARSGSIEFCGDRIDGLRAEVIVRAGIAQVPEGRRVFPYSTVEENLLAGAYTRTDYEEVRADLARVYKQFPVLSGRRNAPARVLSGGQQQMLALGRGLMLSPKLLILDEPSLGLSPLLSTEMFSMIRELREQGLSILMVEQNAHESLAIADRGYVLATGRVALEGLGEDLLQDEEVQRLYLGMSDELTMPSAGL